MFQAQLCGGGGDPAVEALEDSKERAGRDGHRIEHRCTSQEMDANALAKAINPEMELCQRMGNPENPTRASRQGIIRTDKRRV